MFIATRRDIYVVQYEVGSQKLTQPIRLVLITDLHSCDYGADQSRLMDHIHTQGPDGILLVGDIVDDKMPLDKALEFLEQVSSRYPCYYVTGNHEYRTGDLAGVKELVRSYGITVLEGEGATLEKDGQRIDLFGVDDPEAGAVLFAQQLKDCADQMDEERFSLLLSHRPERIDQYRLYGFDLVVSGHAHGGQWRIPGLLNGLLAPHQGFFPKYAGGLYEFEETKLIVSRGLAKENIRIPRLFNRPEVVVIDLKPA